jgi:hypothetical protein
MVPEWRVQTSLAKAGSNLVVGLNAPQTPNQNCADDNDEQNSQLYLPSSTPLAIAEGNSTEGCWREYLAITRASAIQISARTRPIGLLVGDTVLFFITHADVMTVLPSAIGARKSESLRGKNHSYRKGDTH